VQLAFVGSQTSIDLLPTSLPWPAASVRATALGSGSPLAMRDAGSGWLTLSRPEPPFVVLHGTFGAFRTATNTVPHRAPMRIRKGAGGLSVGWNQSSAGTYDLVVRRIDGTVLVSDHGAASAGENSTTLPRMNGLLVATLRTMEGSESRQILLLP